MQREDEASNILVQVRFPSSEKHWYRLTGVTQQAVDQIEKEHFYLDEILQGKLVNAPIIPNSDQVPVLRIGQVETAKRVDHNADAYPTLGQVMVEPAYNFLGRPKLRMLRNSILNQLAYLHQKVDEQQLTRELRILLQHHI